MGVTVAIISLIQEIRLDRVFTIAPELEERRQTRGTLMAKAQSAATLRAVIRTLDIVLEQTRHAIVREPFAQFYDGDQPCRQRQTLRDMLERLLLFFRGLLAIRRNRQSFLVHDRGGWHAVELLVEGLHALDGPRLLVLRHLYDILVSSRHDGGNPAFQGKG